MATPNAADYAGDYRCGGKTLKFDWEDETVSGTVVTRDGKVVNPMLTGEGT